MTLATFDGTRVDSFDAQRYAAIEDEINAACIARDMMLAYAKLQERRALEVVRELRRRDVRDRLGRALELAALAESPRRRRMISP